MQPLKRRLMLIRDRNSFDGKLQDRLFGIFAQSGIPHYIKDACYYEILKLAKTVMGEWRRTSVTPSHWKKYVRNR